MSAEYKLNREINLYGAYLNQFYEFLGLDPIPIGQEYGWSAPIMEAMYWDDRVDFRHDLAITKDGREYYKIFMMQEPVIDFAYY